MATVTAPPSALQIDLGPGGLADIPGFLASDKQLEFLACAARHVVMSGGFGSGKTYLNVLKGILFALQHPGSRGMWVSASYPMLTRSLEVHWKAWRRQWREATGGFDLVKQEKLSQHQIELYNGSVIWEGTADKPDSLWGADLAWFGADEVALWKRAAWDAMYSRLRQTGFPHQCWATYTPYGKGWWSEAFEPDSEKRLRHCELIRLSTHDNPAVDDEFKQSLADRYTGKWAAQYIEGFPQEFEGLVWPGLTACEYDGPLPEADQWERLVAGVDWGWTNPFALLLVGRDKSEQAWAFGEHYETMLRPEQRVTICRDRFEKYPMLEGFFCDPSEPGNIDELKRAGLPAFAADNAVIPGIADVQALVDAHLRIVDCPYLLRESYCWEQKPDGTFRQDKPRKVDDHIADALRYGTRALGVSKALPDWAFR